MRLPAPLSRRDKNVHKNTFGHILTLAGSRRMLGAPALCGLAAMRAGAGLVTLGVPKSLNAALQKKISPVLMTLPLPETREQTLSTGALPAIKKAAGNFRVIALGPGLTQNPATQNFIRKTIATATQPLVIDADGLNALAGNLKILNRSDVPKILTPHPGEMSRLTKLSPKEIQKNRKKIARDFAVKHRVILLLKGPRTIVASDKGKIYINTTGNAGMATAGSGDVLTGMIAALLAQGISGFEAACLGAYLHGKAGDLAARDKTKAAMIATDIIDHIPVAIKKIKNG